MWVDGTDLERVGGPIKTRTTLALNDFARLLVGLFEPFRPIGINPAASDFLSWKFKGPAAQFSTQMYRLAGPLAMMNG
jgi:hypothetical protein